MPPKKTKKVKTRNTINDPAYLAMKAFNERFEDEPDGAFLALAEDLHGWDSVDWQWFAEIQKSDPDYN